VWRNRRWGAAALGRRGSGSRPLPFSLQAVILRGVHAPKDLRAGVPRSSIPAVMVATISGQDSGSRQGRPEILQALKRPQDDSAGGFLRRFAGPACLRRCAAERIEAGHRPSAPAPRRGFTLIEMLVVIAVIAILAGLVAPQVFSNVGDARTTSARAQIENLGLALDGYRLDNHQYPGTAQGLAALMARPEGEPVPANWRGPYLRRALPNDPWGRPYIYRSPGDSVPNGYDLLSYGRDGKAGGAGEDQDITSWGATTR
jgi:general secretion pathway protein G